MGIQDRDYMKRRPDDEGGRRRNSSSESDPEDSLRRFIQKFPRFRLYLGVGGVIIIILAALAAKFAH